MIRHPIRQELEEELGLNLRDEAWEYLVEQGYVEDVLAEAMGIPELADRVRTFIRAFGEPLREEREPLRMLPLPDRQRAAKAVSARQYALSVLLAEHASEDEAAQAFRTRVLAGVLLKPGQVDEWVRQQAEADGPATTWLTSVPVPPEHEIRRGKRFLTTEPPLTIGEDHEIHGFGTRLLAYGVPGEKAVRRIPTAARGILEQLRSLSEQLARSYGWSEAQAALFVLTGGTPIVPLVSATTSVSFDFTALARITLSIDPALTPRDVAEAYRRVRREVLEGRHRNLSEKHARLAAFAATRPAGETWAERMAAWNDEYPEWRYSWRTNFVRDCVRAQRRLLFPNYHFGPSRPWSKQARRAQVKQG